MILGVVMSAIACALSACSQQKQSEAPAAVNVESEKTAIQGTLDKFVQAFEKKDTSLVSSIYAQDPDMVAFGTDSVERWVGHEALIANMKKEIAAFDDVKIAVRDQTIEVDRDGAVAWFSQIMDWDLKTGGQPVHLGGARLTGVLVKRDGNWLIDQFHASMPVSGQAARY